jgi:chitodextrinase
MSAMASPMSSSAPVRASEQRSPSKTPLASNVTYQLFGPLSALTYGNGLALTKTFTQDYLINALQVQDTSTSTSVLNRSYAFGDSINLTGITDNINAARSETYTYTASNRLQQGQGLWGALNWTYDGVGNRTSETLTSGYSNTYNYPSGSNLLTSQTQSSTAMRSFGYDASAGIPNWSILHTRPRCR